MFIPQNKGLFNVDDLPQLESLTAKMEGPEEGQEYNIWAYGMKTALCIDNQICLLLTPV